MEGNQSEFKNGIVDFPFFRCLKELDGEKGANGEKGEKTICKWNDSIWDYPDHVAKVHPCSFYTIEHKNNGKSGKVAFSWTVPQDETQFDRCILKSDDKYFLYEVFFKNSNDTIRHRVWHIPNRYDVKLFSLIAQFKITITLKNSTSFTCETISNTFDEIAPENEIIFKCSNERNIQWILQIN